MNRVPSARLIRVSKSYSETIALESASVEIFPGEVTGLVGPNGSGKTTLTGVLCGLIQPDSGQLLIEGAAVRFSSASDAMKHGIRMLPQALEIYPTLSVLENIFLGQEVCRRIPFLRLMAWGKMERLTKELLRRVDADAIPPHRLASELSGGQQKAVALARLLAFPGKLLVFDEPAAALGVRQKLRLMQIMESEASLGRAVVFISHDLDDVLAVCSRVLVLKRGRVVSDLNRNDADRAKLSQCMGVA